MNRLRNEREPDEFDDDPYDQSLVATERRAVHQAELDALAANEAEDAHGNVVDETMLQPNITFAKSGGGRSSRRSRKRVGSVGRPTIGDESRSIVSGVRRTPTVDRFLKHVAANFVDLGGGQNASGAIEFIVTKILNGDETILELCASFGKDDGDRRSGV